MRRDGGAFVAAVEVARDTVQLAMWEPATGVVRWLTAAEPNVVQFGGVWSPDGQAFYFGSHTESGESVSRIRVDGSGLQEVLRTRWPPSTTPVAVSLGSTLYVEYTWEGRGGLTLNDLNSGAKRDFPLRSLEALRERQPGALVQSDFGGGLSLIDEPTGDVSNVLEGSIEIAGADWDPTGKRIVAAIRARRTREYPVLATMDESGGARHAISGTSGASRPTWVREGILYLWAEIEDWERWDSPYASDEFELFPVVQPPFELHLVNPDTGASRVILRSDTKFGFAVVGG